MGQRLENARALYLEGIRDGNYVKVIEKYAGDRYTQHFTPVKNGKNGLLEIFADFIERNIGEGYDNAGGGLTVDLVRRRTKDA